MTQKVPYYYAATIDNNGNIVEHEGEEEYAVYLEDIEVIQTAGNKWHAWLERNVPNAYNNIGAVLPEVYAEYYHKYEAAIDRLEELRTELRAERISYGELAELQALAPYIDPADVELLQAAGVPETNE